jgi:hypothetical protein
VNPKTIVSVLTSELRALGFETVDVAGGFVRLNHYRIELGRYKGQVIDLAMLVPDYPLTPPAGIHVRTSWPRDCPGMSDSALGADWLYYSRQLTGWLGRSNPHAIMAYVNRVLADA